MRRLAPLSFLELFFRLPEMLRRERNPTSLVIIGAAFGVGGLLSSVALGLSLWSLIFLTSGLFSVVIGLKRVRTAPARATLHFAPSQLTTKPLPFLLCFTCRTIVELPAGQCPSCEYAGECFEVATEIDRRLVLARISAEKGS
jgi:hypothetical protein